MKKQTLLLGVISIGALMSATGCSTKTYTVTFETNGGTVVEAQQVKSQATVTEPKKPTKRPYSFGGWYADEKLEVEYDFSKPVTNNLKLYAKWTDAVSFTYSYHNTNPNENTLNILMYCLPYDEMTGESCGLQINWGDGKIDTYKSDEIPTNWETPFTHTYESTTNKTYTITIRGLVNSISFDATYDVQTPTSNEGNHFIQSANINELVYPEVGCKLALGNLNNAKQNSQLSQYTLPKDLSVLPAGVLANTSITSYTANKNITKIDYGAFYNDKLLKTVDLTPATSLLNISESAFDDCAFESITLPESVSVIDENAFALSSLKTITLKSYMPPYITSSSFLAESLKTIYIPKGRKAMYVSHWQSVSPDIVKLIKEAE